MSSNQGIHGVLLLLVLTLTFTLVYRAHSDYPYPLHVDEWQHISKALQVTGEERLVFTDPHFKSMRVKVTHEEGFSVFMAVLFELTGLDIILFYKFLPALSAVFTAITLYVLARRLFSPVIALTSLFFLASVKSNVNILGFFFYTPLSASFPLMFLTALAVVNALSRDDTAWFAAAILLVLAQCILYPVAAMFMILVSLIYLMTTPGKTRELCMKIAGEKKYLLTYALITFIILAGLTLQYGSTKKFYHTIADRIIFPQNEIPFDVTYSIIKLYGIRASAAAFLGVLVIGYHLARQRGQGESGAQKMLVYWLLIAYLGIFMYHKRDYTIVLPYHRALYYGMLGMAPLSAVGSIWLVRFVRRFFRLPYFFVPVVVAVLFSSVLWDSFGDYYNPPSDVTLYHVIEDGDYTALTWFAGEYGGGHNFLAPYWPSVAVYPVSGNYVSITLSAVYGGGSKDDLDAFFNGDCDTKKRLSRYRGIDHVFSNKVLNCTFLENVYEKDKRFIYEVV
ncbi:MAG: hypothetical protein ABH834_04530 [Candidatus Altiarchaeota archaeon]